MAVRAKKTNIVVDEMAKFGKGEIEFLFELIKNSMIPGKHIHIAMDIVTKLKNQLETLQLNMVSAKEQQMNQIKNMLFQQMRGMGLEPEEYIVGNEEDEVFKGVACLVSEGVKFQFFNYDANTNYKIKFQKTP